MNKSPRLTVFAGANGSGKSTLTAFYRRRLEGSSVLLDPDAVAKAINPNNLQAAAIQAARQVLLTQQRLVAASQSFAIETTLAAKGNLELIEAAKRQGFLVRLLYVGLADPMINLKRIEARVLDGGHDVPKADVLRRYWRSLENLPRAAELVDLFSVHDNSERQMQRVVLVKQGKILRLTKQENSWWEQALEPYLRKF